MFASSFSFGVILLPLIAQLSGSVPVVQAGPVPQVPDSPQASGNYPDPEKCTGVCDWIHDPNIVYDRGLYWRFVTSNNITIATAPSLEGPWTNEGPLLTNGTAIHLRDDQDIWAPSIFRRDGVWFCHYSVSFIGAQQSEIGVAISYKTLDPNDWIDRGSIGLPQGNYNLIDPYVYWDQNDDNAGHAYLTFGSYWSGIQQIELAGPRQMMAWEGKQEDIKNIISNTTQSYAVVEGATTHREGDFYYMFFSVGQCCRKAHELMPPGDEYHVAVCRSESVNGPYHDRDGKDCRTESGGTTILASHGDIYAPGGQGVMVDPKSKRTVMYYHYVRKSVGYEAEQFFFGFNYVNWVDDWPVLVPGGPAPPNV